MTVRAGMAELIVTLRGYCEAGTDDHEINGVTYWTDQHLQDELDRTQGYIRNYDLNALEMIVAGVYQVFDYRIPEQAGEWFEQAGDGSGFVVRDGSGTEIDSAEYAVNYAARLITFSADQGSAVRTLDAKIYDMNKAAAEVWRKKAGFAAEAVDWSSDNHSVKGSQEYEHCLAMEKFHTNKAGVSVGTFIRTDTY